MDAQLVVFRTVRVGPLSLQVSCCACVISSSWIAIAFTAFCCTNISASCWFCRFLVMSCAVLSIMSLILSIVILEEDVDGVDGGPCPYACP